MNMQKRATSEVFELFFTPRFPVLFLLGAALLAVIGNVITDLVKSYLGDTQWHLWLILGVAVALLATVVYLALAIGFLRARLFTKREYAVIDIPHPARRKGLIAFVSLTQRAHLEKAIAYHREALERVWLIATKDVEAAAYELKRGYETPQLSVDVISLDNQWDLLRCKEVVERVYRERLGALTEEDVIADFTGGTKPMTVGMIFACMTPARKLEYVPAIYDGGGAKEPLDPIEYVFDARSIGTLGAATGGMGNGSHELRP